MNLTENQLDEWVRANARDAQGVIVELVWRLVSASSPQPRERRFPLGDSIGQHGPDGFLDANVAFDPFVPEGCSFWEIGTGLRAGDKATDDYRILSADVEGYIRRESTFVFVTPLSGRRDWEYTWKEEAQSSWIEDRRQRGEWRDVRVIDGTKLIDWLRHFPAVGLWLAKETIGTPALQLETPEQRWSLVRTFGEPPPLMPILFLSNREEACKRLQEVIAGTVTQLKLETRFPDQVTDFVSAYLADLDPESRAEAAGRWLIVSGIDGWNAMAAQGRKLTLVADSQLDVSHETGTKLIQRARTSGHSVIFGGPAGGIPDPASVPLPSPRSSQVREALEEAGYSSERARTLAQKSAGNLGSLLRCLQNLSLLPEWAEGTAAADLAVAELLGSWSEGSEADRLIAEDLSGKPYGGWIGTMRDVALRPGTPLTQGDGNWTFVTRFEGWFALGPKLFDEHLGKLQVAATSVLMEEDPQFDLPADERYAAQIHDKVLEHSTLLRKGLVESLALAGSHPGALTSCSLGKAERTAAVVVRQTLAHADWRRWASLNDLLPLLAEAAPREFLRAVEEALVSEPCPFDRVFAEESSGIMGGSYLSGTLWALETLAWDPDHLSRVVMCLGELAARDPGGRWVNRPANSITTILLPWLPQTCAPLTTRRAAVSSLLAELPEVGWKLLVSLLPQSNSTSSGTRRPTWRNIIPDDRADHVTTREYWEQVSLYTEMTIAAAKCDRDKLAELVDHLENLPPGPRQQVLAYLKSEDVMDFPEADRLSLWEALVDLVTKHRRFCDAEWAMEQAQVDQIASVAQVLEIEAPELRHRRLFTERDFDLYEEKGNYKDQRDGLDLRRQEAIEVIGAKGGVRAVLEFAASVESPWRVGAAYGVVASSGVDKAVLPGLLAGGKKHLVQFASGFVWSRFRIRGWQWFDGIDTAKWTVAEVGQVLAYLPFEEGVWERSERLLGEDSSAYWGRTSANPFEADAGLAVAIDELIQHGRPNAAIRCLYKVLHDGVPVDATRAVRALLAAMESSEDMDPMDAHKTVEVIKALQADPRAEPEELLRVELGYLPLLGRRSGARARLLERRLATEPGFFCEVIRRVFPSQDEEPIPEASDGERAFASDAYRLLREWRHPPGCLEDGGFDGEALELWLDRVKRDCKETGHLEIAMEILGRSFIHAPSDPNGLWIHGAVADVLNRRDAGDMRNGFRSELYNSRGTHVVDPTGGPERKLAAQYRGKGEIVENAGFHRLANTLRELAKWYADEAEETRAEGQSGLPP